MLEIYDTLDNLCTKVKNSSDLEKLYNSRWNVQSVNPSQFLKGIFILNLKKESLITNLHVQMILFLQD